MELLQNLSLFCSESKKLFEDFKVENYLKKIIEETLKLMDHCIVVSSNFDERSIKMNDIFNPINLSKIIYSKIEYFAREVFNKNKIYTASLFD